MEALRKAFLIVSFAVATIDATPVNDDYCSPSTLGSGSLSTGDPDLVEFGATNVDATGPQLGEPDGGSDWFGGDGVQASVWYTFQLSGVSCINIFLNNGVLELDWQFALYEYDDSTCPANTPIFTLVAADDDSGGSLGTGSLTPYLKDIYVSDGTYALQVDGWNGETGTADIYVQECFPLDNDDYCDPTNEGTLTVGSQLIFSTTNVDATAQPGEPTPPGTGCNTQDGWCSFETAVQNSVWHTFDVYGPECADIFWDGPGYPDLQFALYEIDGACDTENFYESFSLIAANDDSGPFWSPQIEGAPVDSGKTYVLQVDGFSGTEATGNIRIESFETGGCNPDLDDDGVLNDFDLCPNSDIDEDFNINGCVTTISPPQVAGGVFPSGCTPLQELSRVCFQNFKNPADNIAPGQVRACTAQVLKGWVADEIIQANERGKIMKCLKNVCTTTCAAN